MSIRLSQSVRLAPLLITLLLIGGCGLSRTDRITVGRDLVRGTRFPAVDIRNFNGSVFVRVDERFDEPEVRAHVVVSNQVPKEDRQAALDAVSVDLRVDQQAGGNVIVVEASTPWDRPDLLRVDLHVRLPDCTGLRVENAGGRVDLLAVAGAIQVSNLAFGKASAPVLVRTNRELDEPILLTTDRGSVVLQVTPRARGDLELTSGSTPPAVYARAATAANVTVQGDTLKASIGGGGVPFLLRADKGLVRVMILDDAEAFRSTLN